MSFVRSYPIRVGAISAILVTSLCACAVTPAPEPKPDVPSQWLNTAATGSKLAPNNEPATSSTWLNFNNATLSDLLKRVELQSTDLKAAAARINQARAEYAIAHAGLLPSVTASASQTHYSGNTTSTSQRNPQTQAALTLNYELDVWGKLRATTDAAELAVKASEFDFLALNLITKSDAARAYASWLNYADRINLEKEILDSDNEVLAIIQARVDAGAATALELAQQKSEVASTQANLIALEQQRNQTFNQLALLLGESPIALAQHLNESASNSLNSLQPDTALVLRPADVLKRRPDLQQAEMALKAAHYDVEAAKAALFPSINLSATAIALFSPSAHASEWSIGLLAPLFDGGALKSQRALKSAREQELLANYRGAVLTAFKEVETALQSLDASNRRIDALQTAVTESQTAYQMAKQRYEAGAIDFQTLLQTQRSLLQLTDSLAQAKLAQILALIDIYSSAGG